MRRKVRWESEMRLVRDPIERQGRVCLSVWIRVYAANNDPCSVSARANCVAGLLSRGPLLPHPLTLYSSFFLPFHPLPSTLLVLPLSSGCLHDQQLWPGGQVQKQPHNLSYK